MYDQQESARRILRRILKSPEDFDMTFWYRKSSCGTTACIAGHAGLEMGWVPSGSNTGIFKNIQTQAVRDVSDLGQEFLDLDYETARLLFHHASKAQALVVLHRATQGEDIDEELVMEVLDDLSANRSFAVLVIKLQDEYLTEEERETMRVTLAGYLSQSS